MQNYVDQIVINDVDPLIYAFWKSVVNNSAEFEAMIRTTPVTMDSRLRLAAVVSNPSNHSTLELGFAAFFLNRTSRSGILAGGVIGGKKQNGSYKLDARYSSNELISRIRAIGKLRARIVVLGMDARDLLVDAGPGFPEKSLVYLDPPYYVKGSLLYRNHYEHEDHEAIAHVISLAKYPLLITYDNCPAIRELYRDMNSSTFSLQYSTHVGRPFTNEIMYYANLLLPASPTLTRSATLPSIGEKLSKPRLRPLAFSRRLS
jgi:DNA adenine methylase